MLTERKEERAKLMRRAATLGACLAVLCHFLPAEYQPVCQSIMKAAALTCGGGLQ